MAVERGVNDAVGGWFVFSGIITYRCRQNHFMPFPYEGLDNLFSEIILSVIDVGQ